MTTFVALLRAVNVGGVKLEMAALRSALPDLGYDGVQTYVQSGNVVFRSDRGEPHEHAGAIEALIAREFGLTARVLVLTGEQIAQVAAANPFVGAGADEKTLHVTFLFAPVDRDAFAALELPAQEGEEAVLAPEGVGGDSKPADTLKSAERDAGMTTGKVEAQGTDPAVAHAVYLHVPHGYGRSNLSNAYFERALRTPATTRNWRTVTTLAGLADPGR